MTFAIHDKTPEGRKKLKEGPKAQEKYVEELHSEWIDNHATKDPELLAKQKRAAEIEAMVPPDVKARALRHEADIAERMGIPYDPGKEKLVEDFRERAFRRQEHAMENFVAVLNADVAMLGYIRDFWFERYRLDEHVGPHITECPHCGEICRTDLDDFPVHATEYAMKKCSAIFEKMRAEAREELAAFCEREGIVNG